MPDAVVWIGEITLCVPLPTWPWQVSTANLESALHLLLLLLKTLRQNRRNRSCCRGTSAWTAGKQSKDTHPGTHVPNPPCTRTSKTENKGNLLLNTKSFQYIFACLDAVYQLAIHYDVGTVSALAL